MSRDLSDKEFPFTLKHFEELQVLSREHAGIHVTEDKMEMYYARLAKQIRAKGFTTFDQYIELIKKDEQAFLDYINSITTNVTSFGREGHHFEMLQKMVQASNKKVFRIWSAACSTGQEPYTIATALYDICQRKRMRLMITASDIDSNVLATAKAGIYDAKMLDQFGDKGIKRHFQRGTNGNEGKCRVKSHLKQLIEFRKINLIESWPFQDKFDVIFCRNVMIYFDNEIKRKIVGKFAQNLNPKGVLLIGHSESLNKVSDAFDNIGRTAYQKK